MSEVAPAETSSAAELLGLGRRHLAVKDFTQAADTLSKAIELLVQEHGETGDQCAEAYLWYGKALLGLAREESGVFGDGVPGANAEGEEDDEDQEENADNEEESKNGEAEATQGDAEVKEKGVNEEDEKTEEANEAGGSKPADEETEQATTNGEGDESTVNMENEEDVENLQLAWEMLDLSRSILYKRVQDGGGDAARGRLADVHLALGEVALESETYDKAIQDMQSCLDLQKQLSNSDDRAIAETHYQIALANSLASNFEEAITHFKNAVNLIESRIKILENPDLAKEDATVKKYKISDPSFTIEAEIKELKEILPEIKEKIQDMMDYKTETANRVRNALMGTNGAGESFQFTSQNGAGSSSAAPKPAASDISHLIKRKRKSSEGEASASKRANT